MASYRVQIPVSVEDPDGPCVWGTTESFVGVSGDDGAVYDGVVETRSITLQDDARAELQKTGWFCHSTFLYVGLVDSPRALRVFREARPDDVPGDANARTARFYLENHQPWTLYREGEPRRHESFEGLTERQIEEHGKLIQSRLDELGRVIAWYDQHPDPDVLPLLFGLVGDDDACGWFDELGRIIVEHFPSAAVMELCKEAIVRGRGSQALWAAELVWNLPPAIGLSVARDVFMLAEQSVCESLLIVFAAHGTAEDLPKVEYAMRQVETALEAYKDTIKEIGQRVGL